MDKEDERQTILEALEAQLEAQLRAIRRLQGKPEVEPPPPSGHGSKRESLVDLSAQIMTDEGKPLHVNDLVQLLQQRFGRLTDRGTLSRTLAKKARSRILIEQTAPGTFALIGSKEEKEDKT